MKERFWSLVLRLTPHWTGPLWQVVFSYWDDAAGCSCWREVGYRRWQGPKLLSDKRQTR